MANVAEKIASRLIPIHPLRAVLRQRSDAYGSVAGALDNLHGLVVRGQESEPQGRQAFGDLVNAIHAPRAEAVLLANQLLGLVREVQS